MAVQTLKISGREFVLLPKSEYLKVKKLAVHGVRSVAMASVSKARVKVRTRRLTARERAEEDRLDAAAARKALAEGGESISWEQVKRDLGL